MKRIVRTAVVVLMFLLVQLPVASAQTPQWTDRGFANITFGAQPPSRDLATVTTFDLYDQAGVFSANQDVAGGIFFELSAGYKVWRNLAVGLGFSRVASDADFAVNAQIPHPDFFDSPRAVTTAVSGAQHSQPALHLTGTWMMPMTEKVDLGIQFGPSIFFVSQELPTGISVTEPGPVVNSVTVSSVDATTVGLHFGVDGTYLVTPRIGAGVLIRYVWGSTDLDDAASDSLTLGGLQIGVGLRVRF